MCWLTPADCFVLLRCNTRIEAWQIVKGSLKIIKNIDSDISDAVGLVALDNCTVLCYGSSGTTRSYCIVDGITSQSPTNSISLNVRGPVECASYKDNAFASGGNNNDVQLWDVSTGTRKWSAKNVPHDEVRLAVPIWITAISFFSAESTCGSNVIATGTAYKHVRLYDVRVKRQPIFSWEVGEYRVTRVQAISPYADTGPATVCIADCGGNMHCRDVRTGRVTTTYGSSGGSVRDVSLALTASGENSDMLASVSLDRYLRIHEVGRSELIYKAYLKTRLNCCLCVDEEGRMSRRDSSLVGDDDVVQEYVDSDESGDEEEENSEDDDADREEAQDIEKDILESGIVGSEGSGNDEENDSEDDDEEEEDSDSEHEEEVVDMHKKSGLVGSGGSSKTMKAAPQFPAAAKKRRFK